MFRASVLSIVLALAVGQNASLLCAVWCSPRVDPTRACDHQNPLTSPSLSSADSCSDVAVGGIPFIRDDVRSATSDPDVQHTVDLPGLRFVPSVTEAPTGHAPGQPSPHQAVPLVIALRI